MTTLRLDIVWSACLEITATGCFEEVASGAEDGSMDLPRSIAAVDCEVGPFFVLHETLGVGACFVLF